MVRDDPPELRKRRLGRRVGRRLLKRLAAFQARQSLVGDQPVFEDEGAFPFLAPFECEWRAIRGELDRLLAERGRLPAFHEISPDQYRISRGDRWKVFVLYGFGEPSPANCARCPETARLLRGVPGLQTAMFSILSPHYCVPRHRGVTKGVLRVHLGLKVPAERQRCTMRVGEALVVWQEGKCVVFDDFYPHEVRNETDEERVVLLFDFVRPMRLPGRALNRLLLWGIRRSDYFRDARENLRDWDRRFEPQAPSAEAALDGSARNR
jgi:beta-hydroxylase